MNYAKIFPSYNELSRKTKKGLINLFNLVKQYPSSVHNLTSVITPQPVEICLFLGFKFNFDMKPNYLKIQDSIKEGIRKYAWKVFFMNRGERSKLDELTKIIVKVKKSIGNEKLICPLENVLFGKEFSLQCTNMLKSSNSRKINKLHNYLVSQLMDFLNSNDIVIRQSDKNAGLVLMNRNEYETEINRQLTDINTYTPSSQAHFDYAISKFQDDVKYFSKLQFSNFKINLRNVLPNTSKPAQFYILPKMHKKFDSFPLGRPICSNVHTVNRGIAIILDSILKPLTVHIPNLLIDTPYLLTLLSNVSLDKGKKYCLVAADIQSMYQELPINVCKQNCVKFYNKFKNETQFPFDITECQLKKLLDFSLDFSYIEFKGEFFLQNRGIQMGNNSSVSIANLTAAVELENLWRDQMCFNRRFIDDIFLIVDITNMQIEMSEWLQNAFQHPFLKFTFEISVKSVNFLDLTITIGEDNSIVTTLFSKPMSKHEYLFYDSNHPVHMLNSLPFSCGIRVIRTCSNELDRKVNLEKMFQKFIRRNYPLSLLNNTKEKLLKLDRSQLIQPKSEFHRNHIEIHNPEIILNFSNPNNMQKIDEQVNIFFVLPFYKMPRMKQEIRNRIMYILQQCNSAHLKKLASDINMCFAFTIPDQLQRLTITIESKKRAE